MGRRSIIAVVAIALAGIVAITLAAVVFSDGDRRIGALESSGTGKWSLELNGQQVGQPESVKGCRPRFPVVEQLQTDAQGNTEVDKQIGSVQYVPCVLRLGTSMERPLYEWMKKMLDETPQRRNLTLSEVDTNDRIQTRIEVQDALISRVAFPTFDKAAPNNSALIELTVLPDTLTRTEGQQGTLHLQAPRRTGTSSGFRFLLNGVQSSDKTTIVEPVVVDQKVVEQTGSGGVGFRFQPTSLSVDNVDVAVPRAWASGFAQWLSSTIQDQSGGQAGQYERTGTIELFDYLTTNVVLTLSLSGVGIIEPLGVLGSTQSPAHGYRLYVEGATLILPPVPGQQTTTQQTTTQQTTTQQTTTQQTTTTQPAPTPPPEPPPPPDTLAAPELKATGAEEGRVALDWTAVEGAELYRIYKSGKPGGPYELVSQTKGETTASVTEQSKTLVHFIVRAVAGEVESPDSNEVAVEVP